MPSISSPGCARSILIPTQQAQSQVLWQTRRPNLHSHSAAVFGSRFILKLFRKLDGGVNPDLEISRHLTEQLKFPHAPALVGAIEYHAAGAEPMTVAIMHEFVGNSVQAWEFTLNEFGRYLERVRTQFATVNLNAEMTAELKSAAHWMDLVDQEPTALAREAIGPFLHSAALLGQRTAELHRALVTATDNPAFVPEPFTPAYQRGLFQSMRAHAHHVLQVLKRQLSQLPEDAQADARAIVAIEANIIGRFREMAERRFTAVRIRCHGDYHLGQVLATGDDFKLIDFEGEPMRAIRERRIKCSPLRDVAGMLRSFHYASHAGLLTAPSEAAAPSRDSASLTEWARFHYIWSSAVFVRSYLTHVGDAAFVPTSRDELRCLLDVYLLEKSLYELDYEMNNRPTWVSIPIRGVLDLMGIATETQTAAIGQDGSGAVQE